MVYVHNFLLFLIFFLTGQKVKTENDMCIWILNALEVQMGKKV